MPSSYWLSKEGSKLKKTRWYQTVHIIIIITFERVRRHVNGSIYFYVFNLNTGNPFNQFLLQLNMFIG